MMNTVRSVVSFHVLTIWIGSAVLGVQPPKELKIGYLISYSGPFRGPLYAGAMTKSLEDANNNPNILSKTNLTYMWRDSMCDPHQALAGAVDLYNAGVNVIIGPFCSSACKAVGYLSTGKELPMISYGCSSAEFTEFPFFSRTMDFARTSKVWTSQVFTFLLSKLKWRRVCLVGLADNLYGPLNVEMKKAFLNANITLLYEKLYFPQETFSDKIQMWKEMKDKCRVILLMTRSDQVQDFMVIAYKMGLLEKPGFNFLSIDQILHGEPTKPEDVRQLKKWNDHIGTEHTMDELNRLTMDGVFSVTVDRPNEQETPFLTNFSRDILARANQKPFNENKVIEKNDKAHLGYAVYLYDATFLYARVIDRMLKAGLDIQDPRMFMREVGKIQFKGLVNEVDLDDSGDRIPYYEIVNIQDGKFKSILQDVSEKDLNPGIKLSGCRFPGNTTVPPLDVPYCGFFDDQCSNLAEIERNNLIILGVVGPIIVTVVMTFLIIFYRPKLFGAMCI